MAEANDPADLSGLARQFREQMDAAARAFQAQVQAAMAGLTTSWPGAAPAPGPLSDFELFRRIAFDPALKAKVVALVQAEAAPGAPPAPPPAPG